MLRFTLYLLPFLCFFSACQSNTAKRTTTVICTKTEGQMAVVTDTKEGFFEKITPLEMSIQLRQNLELMPRAELLPKYKQFIQEDVVDFKPEEAKLARNMMEKALSLCYKINPDLPLPDTIRLIKTLGNYYGAGTYYTRDNSIVIPAEQLREDNSEPFLGVLIHEIFHIYSRYNPQKRDELYQLIGFEKIVNLHLSPFLADRVFYNPDGVDMRYAIQVRDSTGRDFQAVPVIYSKYPSFKKEADRFFSYVLFQLFEVKNESGAWQIVNPDVGLEVGDLQGFFEKTQRNTTYIIHPDEILADNFKILALSKQDSKNALMGIDENGQHLLKQIEAVLQQKLANLK